jgi:membrane-anchored protein YejM (alkaline phosphatase superfamily)
MSAEKVRAANPTENTTVLITGKRDKEVYPKLKKSDLFYGDRKKFKIYYTQVRLYIWTDGKRKRKTLNLVPE